MFIDKITIKNFRLFSAASEFVVDNLNVPDAVNSGTGLNVFVGENGSGKTALLDAFVLPILEYKTGGFTVNDFNKIDEDVQIKIFSKEPFDVAGTMPKSLFKAEGFIFEAKVRSKDNKAYLSSIVVSDQKFIKNNPDKPVDGSPDLRVNVNNPFKGKRFDENEILFLDKNRLFQTRSGNYNTTKFDKLMEDFDYQYIANLGSRDLNESLKTSLTDKVENDFLSRAIIEFNAISGCNLSLELVNNLTPFKNAFFAENKSDNLQILLSNLGSGYEMMFTFLYSFYLSQRSHKKLIVFIDEPELHLHPALQEKFISFILESSKHVQIFLTSHSSLLIKQLSENEKVKIKIIRNGQDVLTMEKRVLSYISSNETNYLAFGLATEEYHNELFEELKCINGDTKCIKDFDNDFFVKIKNEPRTFPWKGFANEVSIHTFIRNQIHHQKDNGKAKYPDLKSSISKMRSFL